MEMNIAHKYRLLAKISMN